MSGPPDRHSGAQRVREVPDRLPRGPSDEFVSLCRGCARVGCCRLGVRAEWLQGETLHARAWLSSEHEGGRGIAHGGVVAALLDEVCGHLCKLLGPTAVTHSLQVRYQRPVPIRELLALEARSITTTDRGRIVHGRIALQSGVVVALASGRFVFRRADHYDRFDSWLETQRRQTGGG